MDEIIEMLKSKDYKERSKGEYYLLLSKISKLENLLEDYKRGTLDFKPNCPYGLLERQLYYMQKYKIVLEERFLIEDIKV